MGRSHPDPGQEALETKWQALESHCLLCLLPQGTSGCEAQCPVGTWTRCPSLWVVFQVEPFASLSEAVQKSVPRLLINRDLVGPFAWSPRSKDVAQLGDVVEGVERLVDLLGWTQELQDLIQRETGKVNALGTVQECILFWALTSVHCGH